MQDEIKSDEKFFQQEPNIISRRKSSFRRHFRVFVTVVLISLSFYAGFFWSQYKSAKGNNTNIVENLNIQSHDKSQPEDVDFGLFWEAWNLVSEKYVDPSKIDNTKMVYGAISGMIKSLNDPFSSFMNPEESRQFSDDMQGTFEGIGTEIGIKNDILTIIAPLEGTPADHAGLKAGDKIIKIDDTVTTDLTVDQAVAKIRGPKGSSVALTILRENNGTPMEIKITRETISVQSIKLEFKEGGVTLLRISRFGDDTTLAISRAVNQILEKNSKGLVVDLRNNPGGYLETAVDVSSKFVPRDQLVVAEEDRGGSRKEYKARGGAVLQSIPIVILVNGGSASASEIMAGALRDELGAVLVGEKTFGKGSVQQLEKLTGGSSLRVTIARWLTPKGEYIMEKGLSPDVEVKLSDDDYNQGRDPQMDKALEILREKMQ